MGWAGSYIVGGMSGECTSTMSAADLFTIPVNGTVFVHIDDVILRSLYSSTLKSYKFIFYTKQSLLLLCQKRIVNQLFDSTYDTDVNSHAGPSKYPLMQVWN